MPRRSTNPGYGGDGVCVCVRARVCLCLCVILVRDSSAAIVHAVAWSVGDVCGPVLFPRRTGVPRY